MDSLLQLPIKAGRRCSAVSPPQVSTPAATMIRTATLLAITLLLLLLLPVHTGEGLAEIHLKKCGLSKTWDGMLDFILFYFICIYFPEDYCYNEPQCGK